MPTPVSLGSDTRRTAGVGIQEPSAIEPEFGQKSTSTIEDFYAHVNTYLDFISIN